MRRQNHSCDQCRKAKRACDAPPLKNSHNDGSDKGISPHGAEVGQPEWSSPGFGAIMRIRALDSAPIPCSYCLRTRKRCTMNWARSQQLKAGASAPNESSRNKRRRTNKDAIPMGFSSHSETSFSDISSSVSETVPQIRQLPSLGSPKVPLWNEIMGSQWSPFESEPAFSAVSDTFLQDSACPLLEIDGSVSFEDRTGYQATLNEKMDDFGSFSGTSNPEEACIAPTFERRATYPGFRDMVYANSSVSNGSMGGLAYSVLDDRDVLSCSPSDGLFSPSQRWQSTFSTPPTVDAAMVTKIYQDGISQNLLQIYHDVLEHNLSCWLTPETCPYKGDYRSRQISVGTHELLNSPAGTLANMQRQEYQGDKWSNRIYTRVIELDRIAQSRKLIHLTTAQNQKVQRALHLVIMAFATQWAHNSQRQRELYEPNGLNADFGSLPEEFDRHLQRSLWEQARSALQDCANIESFRVVCAELIFGLTQEPWEEGAVSELEKSGTHLPETDQARIAAHGPVVSQISQILAKEGPPIFMERAARKIHALKFKFDWHEAGASRQCDRPVSPANPSDPINPQDRETVALLFWLAVMFDTLSSSVNERPVVLADEDSQHEAAENVSVEDGTQPLSLQQKESPSHRWRIDLFIQDNPERSSQSQVRWPCSYDEAAKMVTRSAPVKVLLYRYVHYLQKMVKAPKKTSGQPIEDGIQDALLVYRYWNNTYGPFFRDLVEQYSSVPPRIRGWFVCIAAHWHLASLMLADLIELVDDNERGLPAPMQARLNAHTVASIRKSSANQLSDLARVATPGGSGHIETEPQLPTFHSAVQEGAVLTEPWTVILIRAFTKAAMLHLQAAADMGVQSQQDILGYGREMIASSLRRCEECTRALWFLGKKSDMARNIALVLAKALDVAKGPKLRSMTPGEELPFLAEVV